MVARVGQTWKSVLGGLLILDQHLEQLGVGPEGHNV